MPSPIGFEALGGVEISQPHPSSFGLKKTVGRSSSRKYCHARFSNSAAPGHGVDDYHTGLRYGLEVYAQVGPGGHFLDEVELFAGLRVFDANPVIIKALEERGRLWKHENYGHSYPHCWRCHHPVIFLATSQWFIAMEKQRLRQRALMEIDQVNWIPSWGRDRIYNMIAFRPDWCISRH